MLKIYGVPVSVHTRKVIVAAIEKKLPYENDPVIPFNPPAGWDKLSPTGKIPVMSDGDFDLADSSVICAYLEQTHPEPALFPQAAKDRARSSWLEEYCDSTVYRDVIHVQGTHLVTFQYEFVGRSTLGEDDFLVLQICPVLDA